ncbi:MAG: glycosyltransferase [Anaerolineaceae bacterium 4572_78]|nr:MAG: glycosyltransferase [Anaerolineaceae bacterium 4572_78]
MSNPQYSVIAPVYNEEETLPEFYRQIKETMDSTNESWEIILINDGSRDRSWEIMQELRKNDPRVKILSFAKNFGHQPAVTAGLDFTMGNAVVMIDSDLQDPPSVILDMIVKWKEGYDLVYGVRSERKGETWFKEVTAKLFYRIIFHITDVNIPLDTGDFRLMDRKVVDVLQSMRERHRFIRGMTVWIGFKQAGVEYVREERFAGTTKYPFKKMFKFALDAITSFSYVPLQIATYFGFSIAGLSAIGTLFVVYARLFMINHEFTGQATTLVAVLFLGGIQLITLGIMGEYLGRIYDEVKGRPLYVVRDMQGFEDSHVAETYYRSLKHVQ